MGKIKNLYIDQMNDGFDPAPQKIYLLMDGNTVIHAYVDEQLALMEAHICLNAANIHASMRQDILDRPSDNDIWVKTMTIDYTPFDWLGASECEQDEPAQLDLFPHEA